MEITHDFPFDPSYGYKLHDLLNVQAPKEEPNDFDHFWASRREQAMACTPRFEMKEVEAHAPGRRTFQIQFATVAHPALSGWIDLPSDGPIERGLVMLHGYGGRPEGPEKGSYLDRCAVISPGLRGLAPSFSKKISDDCWQHVVHGIESREAYVLGGCVEDVWCATNALIAAVPGAAESLHLIGGSFGGGLGLMALAYDDRFQMAQVSVPTFGHQALRVTLPCNGSGHAVSRRYQEDPEVMKVLEYFDSATAARRVQIPVLATPALFDPAVPPPGQFAACNAIAGPTTLWVKKAGHFEYPGQAKDDTAEFEFICKWFADEAGANEPKLVLAPSLQGKEGV